MWKAILCIHVSVQQRNTSVRPSGSYVGENVKVDWPNDVRLARVTAEQRARAHA